MTSYSAARSDWILQLTDKAINWLADQITIMKESEERSSFSSSVVKVGFTNSPLSVNSINRNAARFVANQRVISTSASDIYNLVEQQEVQVAEELCRLWGKSTAGVFARAWLFEDVEYLRGQQIAMHEIATIIGVAAAAAILAVILVFRRTGTATIQGRRYNSSPDFELLRKCAQRIDEAGKIATRLIDGKDSPWSLKLEEVIHDLDVSKKRILLTELINFDPTIEHVCPLPGVLFDPYIMKSVRSSDNDSVWVIAKELDGEAVGFKRGSEILLAVNVEICTADWWALTGMHPNCVIGQAIRECPEKYTGLEAKYASSWTVAHGLRYFANLRRDFDEVTLNEWRMRFAKDMKSLDRRIEKELVELGEVGQSYDPSVMKELGTSPVAAAKVVEVVERNGIPQRGLGCRRAPPLLYAIVRVEEE